MIRFLSTGSGRRLQLVCLMTVCTLLGCDASTLEEPVPQEEADLVHGASTSGHVCSQNAAFSLGSGGPTVGLGWCMTRTVAVSDVEAALRNFVNGTDATYYGLISSGDLILANERWVAWIDRARAPGVIRGLWPTSVLAVPANLNPGFNGAWLDFQNARYKSLLQINQGWIDDNLRLASTNGYKGLHVELWSQPGDGAHPAAEIWMIPNASTAERAISLYPDPRIDAGFVTTLVSGATGCNRYRGPGQTSTTACDYGGYATLRFWITYVLTPMGFELRTSLRTLSGQVARFEGPMMGIGLLTNKACLANQVAANCSQVLNNGLRFFTLPAGNFGPVYSSWSVSKSNAVGVYADFIRTEPSSATLFGTFDMLSAAHPVYYAPGRWDDRFLAYAGMPRQPGGTTWSPLVRWSYSHTGTGPKLLKLVPSLGLGGTLGYRPSVGAHYSDPRLQTSSVNTFDVTHVPTDSEVVGGSPVIRVNDTVGPSWALAFEHD